MRKQKAFFSVIHFTILLYAAIGCKGSAAKSSPINPKDFGYHGLTLGMDLKSLRSRIVEIKDCFNYEENEFQRLINNEFAESAGIRLTRKRQCQSSEWENTKEIIIMTLKKRSNQPVVFHLIIDLKGPGLFEKNRNMLEKLYDKPIFAESPDGCAGKAPCFLLWDIGETKNYREYIRALPEPKEKGEVRVTLMNFYYEDKIVLTYTGYKLSHEILAPKDH